ncbi:Fic family protein [Schwartzia succinivorans]|nr:Fic family protein [Schwartzia succinivorans]
MLMNESYKASKLPLPSGVIDYSYFVEELIDATAKLEVYKEKIHDSKLGSEWFMPTLQQKEALASSAIEGTQATLDGVLTYQTEEKTNDQNLNEVLNYHYATTLGYRILAREKFTDDFFYEMHIALMRGNVRKPELIGKYRVKQNYIGKNDPVHTITFIPPAAEEVHELMANLIEYMNNPNDSYRPLVRTAIIHAQFETIHPFMDGNGRVGRMLIPMYLFYKKQIDLPCFFISEALEHDKHKYYTLLTNIRTNNDWNEWIKFFLETVAKQCDKYIMIISEINNLYEKHLSLAMEKSNSPNIVQVITSLYKCPVTTVKQLSNMLKMPTATLNRFLNILLENKILYTNGKQRNRTFYYYDLLGIIRN